MTPEEIQDYLRQNRVTKDMADEDFASYIKRYVKENDEVLQKLGSDIDENGTPYWLKSKEKLDDDGGLSQRGYNLEQLKGRDDV
jgi:hypothetical protein